MCSSTTVSVCLTEEEPFGQNPSDCFYPPAGTGQEGGRGGSSSACVSLDGDVM